VANPNYVYLKTRALISVVVDFCELSSNIECLAKQHTFDSESEKTEWTQG